MVLLFQNMCDLWPHQSMPRTPVEMSRSQVGIRLIENGQWPADMRSVQACGQRALVASQERRLFPCFRSFEVTVPVVGHDLRPARQKG